MTHIASNPTPSPLSTQTLRKQAIRGSLWTVFGQGAGQVLRLASNLALTRLLFPEAFGLMALVGVFTQGLQMFSDIGIGPSIVQHKRGDDPDFLNTAWTIQVIRGFALWIIACGLAWPIAQLYGEQALLVVLPVAAFATVIGGFQSTSIHALNRHLAVGAQTALNIATQFISITVMVVWACFWPSVWALVAGVLVSTLVRTVLSFVAIPGIRNRFRWDATARDELIRFGKWIFLSTVLTFLSKQADRLMLGKLVSLEMLGVYSIAVVWSMTATESLLRIGQTVVFPVYSKLKTSGRGIGSALEKVRRPISVGGGITASLLIVGGSGLIELLYDARYAQAGLLLQIMAAGAWFIVLAGTTGPALLALGESRWIAASNVAKLLGLITLIPIGHHYQGLPGVVIALSLTELFKYIVLAIGLHRHQLPVAGNDIRLTIQVAIGVAMALAADLSAREAGLHAPVAIAIGVTVVCVFWVPTVWNVKQQIWTKQV